MASWVSWTMATKSLLRQALDIYSYLLSLRGQHLKLLSGPPPLVRVPLSPGVSALGGSAETSLGTLPHTILKVDMS